MPNPYLDPVFSEWYKTRIVGAMICVLIAFAVLGFRLFVLQVLEGAEYRRLSENNCIRLQTVDAPRGVLMDRDRTLLVDNRAAFNLNIILRDAQPVAETLARLARHTGIPVSEFEAAIAEHSDAPAYRPIPLLRDIGRDLLAVVEAHRFDLPGVVVEVQARRHYMKGVAPHLIGYLSEIRPDELESGRYPGARGGDYVGRYGIEYVSESLLRGTNGGRQVEVDARGRVIRVLDTVDPVPGRNLVLTIDLELQRRAETLLSGKVGALVAMDPANGEVLAMASSPAFNPNAFVKGMSHTQWRALVSNPDRPMENKVVQGEYPPASTYKVVTAMAALESGVIDTEAEFYCPGHLFFGDRIFRCWRRGGHGHVNVVEAIAVSCDVFFYQVGHRLGVDRLAEYAAGCGLGRPTGIALGNEAKGLIPTAAWKRRRTGVPWQQGETLSIAIGQGYNLVTPLQMVTLTAAVANGGTLYRPRLIRWVEDMEGNVVEKRVPEPVGKLPVRPETLEIIRKGLWEVVNGARGTARRATVEGVRVSGKTGTAQVISRRTEEMESEEMAERHKPHAWFIAIGETAERQIAVSVLVEHGESGSGTAAPLAAEIIRTHFSGAKSATVAGLAQGE